MRIRHCRRPLPRPRSTRSAGRCRPSGRARFDMPGERVPKYTGVWTHGRKIASIGVHARDWVTWHGFALNVTTELSYFDLMVPCGIPDVTMTSVERELVENSATNTCYAPSPNLAAEVQDSIIEGAGKVFGLTPNQKDAAEIEHRLYFAA